MSKRGCHFGKIREAKCCCAGDSSCAMKEPLLKNKVQSQPMALLTNGARNQDAPVKKPPMTEFSAENLRARSETVTEVLRKIMNRPLRESHHSV